MNGARKFLAVDFVYMLNPESEDCKREYDLEEEDFHKECNCDFFDKK